MLQGVQLALTCRAWNGCGASVRVVRRQGVRKQARPDPGAGNNHTTLFYRSTGMGSACAQLPQTWVTCALAEGAG
jgi:hypothetical protein